jgi:virginiamycin A acetyltransferase
MYSVWGIDTNINAVKFGPRTIRKRTTIGPGCWICDNSVIITGVKLAIGTVVGAGSVVTKNTNPFEIIAGNPARVIGKRFSSDTVREKVLASGWWDRDIGDLFGLNYDDIDSALEDLVS